MAIAVVEATGPTVVEIKRGMAQAAMRLASRPIAGVRKVWGIAVDRLHLDAGVGYTKTAWNWLSRQMTTAGGAVGWLGGAGIAMLALASDTGRKVINATVGTAYRVVRRVAKTGLNIVRRGLSHLGGFGRWINAHVIDNIEGVGIIAEGFVKNTYKRHVAKHVEPESPQMETVRAAGATMIMAKVAMTVSNPVLSTVAWVATAGYAAVSALFSAGAFGLLGKKAQESDRKARQEIAELRTQRREARDEARRVREAATAKKQESRKLTVVQNEEEPVVDAPTDLTTKGTPRKYAKSTRPRRTSAQVQADKVRSEKMKANAAAKAKADDTGSAEAVANIMDAEPIVLSEDMTVKEVREKLVAEGHPADAAVAFSEAPTTVLTKPKPRANHNAARAKQAAERSQQQAKSATVKQKTHSRGRNK